MIIKGREGRGGQALVRYLEGGKNEHAELLELRNIEAVSLKQAIYLMDTLAAPSNTKNHAYHVIMRSAPGERLSAETWRDAVDRVTEAFGMQDNQAAVVLHHQEDGCTHCHLVVNRVNPETMTAADLWQNHYKHNALARQMEIDYGLQIVSNEKSKKRNYSNDGMGEHLQAHRTGENVHDIRDRIKTAWESSDNGQSFSAALEANGFTLATGDRRDFVAVSEQGNAYSIGKRTTGASPADVRAKLSDLDPANIPSVQAVKIALELAAEEELKNEKERKGKGEASAANIMKEAQTNTETPFPKTHADRQSQWEIAAAARVDRLRENHAREYEKQQQGFDKAANLETGAAVKAFNDLQRCDASAALLKSQAEELAQEYQRQQIKREDYAAAQIWRQYKEENRDSIETEAKRYKPNFRKGGFKQNLRDGLTQHREESSHTYSESDLIKEERARNQAARERQEAARQQHSEPTLEKQGTVSNDNDRAAKIEERLKQYHEEREAKAQRVRHGKKLKPHLGG